jgi:hypothetical protein
MANIIEGMKEVRNWIILLLILCVVGGGYNAYHQSKNGKAKDTELADAKKEAAEARKKAEIAGWAFLANPTFKIVYVNSGTGKPQPPIPECEALFGKYCDCCKKGGVDPNIELDVTGASCTANLCTKKGSCTLKPEGITIITPKPDNPKKDILWKQKGLLVMDLVSGQPGIGYAPLDYKGINPTLTLTSDFKKVEDTRVGLGISYFWNSKNSKWKSNLGVYAGASSPVSAIKDVGIQAGLVANVFEKVK